MRALPQSYAGKRKLVRELESRPGRARPRPLSLASGDFDGDGVADLVVGYGAGSTGILVLYRGNVDSIYPNTPEARTRRDRGTATDSPFIAPGQAFSSPERPDFLFAGDFNGDRKIDLIVAAEGGHAIHVLPGNDAAGFEPPVRMPVAGAVTTMIAGEIDRADGFPDVVLGVASADVARLVVYQSPAGALAADPVVIDIPAPATSLLLGQMDDEVWMDLAATAGKTFLILHGRDGLLGSGRGSPAEVERIEFSAAVRRAALGDLDADLHPDVALLFEDGSIRTGPVEAIRKRAREGQDPARAMEAFPVAPGTRTASSTRIQATKISSGLGDDLLVVEPGNRRIVVPPILAPSRHAGTSEDFAIDLGGLSPRAVLPMRLNADALMDLVVLSEEGTEGSDGSRVVLALTSPGAVFTVTTTADGGPGSLRNAIDQANAVLGADTIRFNIGSGGPQSIQPLSPLPGIFDSVTIDGATQPGFAGSPIIELDGSAAGSTDGIQVFGSPSVIRGLVINRWSQLGIYTSPNTGHIIEGNFIGTDLSGTTARPNGYGVLLTRDNILGGTTAGAGNVVSGNLGDGVSIYGSNNFIKGNLIGTNAAGTAALGNFNGIKIWDGNNEVGGIQGRNVISGNSYTGIDIGPGGPGGNRIDSNLVGLDINCATALPNGNRGIEINSSPFNTVTGNIIAGNTNEGLTIANPGADNNAIFANQIGSCANAPLGNGANGVRIVGGASNNSVGLGMFGGNSIVYNGEAGIFVDSGSGNRILYNQILDNGGLGIDLGPGTFSNGVTPNDPGDGDTGANGLQNYPLLTTASACGSSAVSTTRILGNLASLPSANFHVQLFSSPSCDATGFGEGQTVLTVEPTVATDTVGNGSFEINLPAFMTGGSSLTATATDALGNTSEFSACLSVTDITPPGEATQLAWAAGSKTNLTWLPVPGANSYRVHRGFPWTLFHLTTPIPDACWRTTTTSTSTGPVLTETPPAGVAFWYLVRPLMDWCEGPAGSGSAGPRIQNSAGICADAQSCSHASCSVGGPLVSGCDPCVSAICAVDPFCCGAFWDSLCVNEVRTVCGSLACGASQGACAHPHCSVGSPLTSGCDDPPVTPSCVSRICASDPYCCTVSWDGICVEEVTTICGQGCY